MNYVTTRHSRAFCRDRYDYDPTDRVVKSHDRLVADRLAQLLEARTLEANALKRGNRSDAAYRHITVRSWENWFLTLDSTQGGNI